MAPEHGAAVTREVKRLEQAQGGGRPLRGFWEQGQQGTGDGGGGRSHLPRGAVVVR